MAGLARVKQFYISYLYRVSESGRGHQTLFQTVPRYFQFLSFINAIISNVALGCSRQFMWFPHARVGEDVGQMTHPTFDRGRTQGHGEADCRENAGAVAARNVRRRGHALPVRVTRRLEILDPSASVAVV